jgi:hypothetical protein
MEAKKEKQKKKRQIILGITVVVMGLVAAMAADTNPVMVGDINPGTADLDLITAEAMAEAMAADINPVMVADINPVMVDITPAMVDTVPSMAADTVDISRILVDMADINPVMDMADTEIVMAATEDMDTTKGMVTDLLMEDTEALLMEEAPMETFSEAMETIRIKKTKIPKPTKLLNLIIPTLTAISIKFTTTLTSRTITKQTP